MIIIVCLSSVVVVAIGVTFVYIKFMDFVQKNYPTYIGEGLRNSIIAYLGLSKPRSNGGYYASRESIPIKIARYLKNSACQVTKRARICGLIQYIVQKMPVFKYRYQEYTYAQTKNGYSKIKYLLSHIKRIISRRKRRCNQKQIKP